MMKTILKVPGMMCQHCEKTVKGALEALEGVHGVAINLEHKTASVEHEESVTASRMRAVLDDLGYEAE